MGLGVRTCWTTSPRSRRPGSSARPAARSPCAPCADGGPSPRRCPGHGAFAGADPETVPGCVAARTHSGTAW